MGFLILLKGVLNSTKLTTLNRLAELLYSSAGAEAEANEKIKNSLNDQIIKSKFYDKWNGELPNVMGSDSVITNIGE